MIHSCLSRLDMDTSCAPYMACFLHTNPNIPPLSRWNCLWIDVEFYLNTSLLIKFSLLYPVYAILYLFCLRWSKSFVVGEAAWPLMPWLRLIFTKCPCLSCLYGTSLVIYSECDTTFDLRLQFSNAVIPMSIMRVMSTISLDYILYIGGGFWVGNTHARYTRGVSMIEVDRQQEAPWSCGQNTDAISV